MSFFFIRNQKPPPSRQLQINQNNNKVVTTQQDIVMQVHVKKFTLLPCIIIIQCNVSQSVSWSIILKYFLHYIIHPSLAGQCLSHLFFGLNIRKDSIFSKAFIRRVNCVLIQNVLFFSCKEHVLSNVIEFLQSCAFSQCKDTIRTQQLTIT